MPIKKAVASRRVGAARDRLTAGRICPAYATLLNCSADHRPEGAGAMGRPMPVVGDGEPVVEVRDGGL